MTAKKKKKKALGRGLDALFPGADKAMNEDPKALKTLDLTKIKANPNQPRRSFHEDKIDELAESIKERGVLQPVIVRPVGKAYQLVAGERRFRAAGQAGLKKIPVIIVQANDEQALEIALVENLQRENLSPIEEARGYEELIKKFGLTQEEAALRVGKERSTVANSLRLLRLPPTIREDLEVGRISSGHARALLSLADKRLQAKLWSLIVQEGMSVRQAENWARERAEGKKKPKATVKKPPRPADVAQLEEQLMTALGSKVRVKQKSKTAGTITIHYGSLEDVERILEALGITNDV